MFILNSSFVKNQPQNNLYARQVKVFDERSFKNAILNDHVMATFTDAAVRRKDCFVSSNVLFGDIDNSHTDFPDEFINLDDIKGAFAGYEVWIATSKSHMLQKDGKAARPKFHLYFPVDNITNGTTYEQYLIKLIASYDYLYFDPQCKNSSRHFGATLPSTQITILHGEPITKLLDTLPDPKVEVKQQVSSSYNGSSYNSKFDELKGVSDGRKKNLYAYACSCKARGFTDQEIVSECYRLNSTFMPPQTREEVEKAAYNAIKNPEITRGVKQIQYQHDTTTTNTQSTTNDEIPNKDEDPQGYLNYYLEKLDRTFAYVSCGNNLRVVSKKPTFDFPPMAGGVFAEAYFHDPEVGRVVITKRSQSKKGEYEDKPAVVEIAKEWLRKTYRYAGMSFRPDVKGNINFGDECMILNTFTGFPYKVDEDTDVKDAEKFLYHLKHNICRDNEEHYEYLDSWFANIIQKPELKSGIAIAIRGDSGVGKSAIFEIFSLLLGNYAVMLPRMSDITNNFNAARAEKLFCYIDDSKADAKTDLSVLKSSISADKVLIERKGIDAREELNYCRFAVTSNDFDVIKLDNDDRRWFVLDAREIAPDEKAAQEAFLWDLKDKFFFLKEGDRYLKALLKHWMTKDIKNFKFRPIPETEASRRAKYFGENIIVTFVKECATDTCPDEYNIFRDGNQVSVKFFKKNLQAYVKFIGIPNYQIPAQPAHELKRAFGNLFHPLNQAETGGTSYYEFDVSLIKVMDM